jgi:hypothetical protein
VSRRQLSCCACDDLADDLMTWNELRLQRREISFNDVQVGTTNPAGNDAKRYVPRLHRRTGTSRILGNDSVAERSDEKTAAFIFRASP